MMDKLQAQAVLEIQENKNLEEAVNMSKKENTKKAQEVKEIKKLEEDVNMTKEVKEVKVEEVQEVKAEEVQEANQATEFEKSMSIIRELVEKAEELKITESEAKTGFSYFSGKTRICKILKTKRGIALELNVQLPKKYDTIPGIEKISAATAYKKHLGTMKYLYKAGDASMVKELISESIKALQAISVKEQEQQAQ